MDDLTPDERRLAEAIGGQTVRLVAEASADLGEQAEKRTVVDRALALVKPRSPLTKLSVEDQRDLIQREVSRVRARAVADVFGDDAGARRREAPLVEKRRAWDQARSTLAALGWTDWKSFEKERGRALGKLRS